MQGEASPPVSAGFAAAAKRAGTAAADDAPEPDTPFYRGLKAILGRSGECTSVLRLASGFWRLASPAMEICSRSSRCSAVVCAHWPGGVESEKRVAALEKLMAGHAKGLEQRKLLVRYERYWRKEMVIRHVNHGCAVHLLVSHDKTNDSLASGELSPHQQSVVLSAMDQGCASQRSSLQHLRCLKAALLSRRFTETLHCPKATTTKLQTLQVRVIDLSSDAAKAWLAGGGGVATLGAWLLEAATAGKAKFAADVLATLDGLPIGMKALRSAGIGKTVSAPQAPEGLLHSFHTEFLPVDLNSPSAAGIPDIMHEAVVAAQRSLCMQPWACKTTIAAHQVGAFVKEHVLPPGANLVGSMVYPGAYDKQLVTRSYWQHAQGIPVPQAE